MGKNTPWVIREEAENPKGEGIMSTLVSLGNKQGDCLEEFYGKAVLGSLFERMNCVQLWRHAARGQSVPNLWDSNWTNALEVPRDGSGSCFQILLIHPQELDTTLRFLSLDQGSCSIRNKRQTWKIKGFNCPVEHGGKADANLTLCSLSQCRYQRILRADVPPKHGQKLRHTNAVKQPVQRREGIRKSKHNQFYILLHITRYFQKGRTFGACWSDRKYKTIRG